MHATGLQDESLAERIKKLSHLAAHRHLNTSSILLVAVFLIGGALATIAAWLLACTFDQAKRPTLEAALAWALTFVGLVAMAGIVLGAVGALGSAGFITVHAAVCGALLMARKKQRVADWEAARALGREVRRLLTWRTGEGVCALGLLVAFVALLALAVLAEPVVYDALTYRLSRIGAWLQSGRIGVLATNDPRLNYMPVVPDLFMAWLMTATRAGYAFTSVAQAFGGAMALAATIGLARQTGLSRRAAILAAALLLGMANVVPQFTSVHTDLFTTGIFTATFYLWLCALRRGEGSALAGAGAGLALGAKGTLLYLGPGALLWTIMLSWRHPLAWRFWRTTLLAGLISAAIYAGPVFVRNWQTYGGMFGPKEFVQMHHHGTRSAGDLARKLRWNLTTSLAQLFEPNSQPAGLREASHAAGTALAARLPAHDEYTYEQVDRRAALTEIMERREPDADSTTFGVITAGLFFFGTGAALFRWREAAARLVLVWSAGVMGSLIFFHAMQQWHPFEFRYFVLAAPWVAVVGAWGIETLGARLRVACWGIALLATLNVGWCVSTRTHQVGWRAVVQPTRSRGYFVLTQWRQWAAALDRPSAPLEVALPFNLPLAAFYRQPAMRPTVLYPVAPETVLTAEEFVRGHSGWTIVPASRFLGREGPVAARTWLFNGDELSPFSLAAYRSLAPHEMPDVIIYRQKHTETADAFATDLLVKTWHPGATRLLLTNPGREKFSFRVLTPSAEIGGELAAGEQRVCDVTLPAGKVSEIRVLFAKRAGVISDSAAPTAELAP